MIYNFFKNYLKHYKGISQNGWVILTANLINKTGSATALFLSIYLHMHLYYSLVVSGILIGSYGAGCILGSFLGGVLSDKVKPVFILILSLLISAIFFYYANHHNKILPFTWVVIFIRSFRVDGSTSH